MACRSPFQPQNPSRNDKLRCASFQVFTSRGKSDSDVRNVRVEEYVDEDTGTVHDRTSVPRGAGRGEADLENKRGGTALEGK